MQKTLITLASIGILGLAGIASAATISLSPTAVSVTKGQTFSVVINADPAGAKLYTVKAKVSYPAALLEATGYMVDPTWPLTPPGNSIDNTNGTLIQTAGFVGGFTAVKKFGTITFIAKESGSATIAVGSDSAAYDAQSKNQISGTQGSSVVTIAAAVAPAPKTSAVTKPTNPTASPNKATPVAARKATTTTEEATTTAMTGTSTEVQAAAAGAGFLGGYGWLPALAALLIVLGGGVWYARRR